jgi:hypothetical protein
LRLVLPGLTVELVKRAYRALVEELAVDDQK